MLRDHHYVLQNFISRDLKVKYRGTVLGYFWSLLEPMAMVLVYFFLFSVVMRHGGPHYPLELVLGLLPFTLMSNIIKGGANALVANAALILRVSLPREIYLFAHAGSQIVVFLLSLVSALPFLIYYQVMPSLQALWMLPLVTLLMALFSLALAMVLACLNTIYRDVNYVLQVVLRILFYFTPVLYQVTAVPEKLRGLYLLNPLSVFISAVRSAVLGTPLGFSSAYLWGAALVSILGFSLSLRLFSLLEAKAVKFL